MIIVYAFLKVLCERRCLNCNNKYIPFVIQKQERTFKNLRMYTK